jgi:hypothetical protein
VVWVYGCWVSQVSFCNFTVIVTVRRDGTEEGNGNWDKSWNSEGGVFDVEWDVGDDGREMSDSTILSLSLGRDGGMIGARRYGKKENRAGLVHDGMAWSIETIYLDIVSNSVLTDTNVPTSGKSPQL